MNNRALAEILVEAKAGSTLHLGQFPTLIPTHFHAHHSLILDAIFENLKLPHDDVETPPLDPDKAMVLTFCYIALIHVNKWLAAQSQRTPTTAATSLFLTQNSSRYIYWACRLLESIRDHNLPLCQALSQVDSYAALDLHSQLSQFFFTLVDTPTTLLSVLTKDWAMIEVVVRLWTAQPTGRLPVRRSRMFGKENETVSLFERFVLHNAGDVTRMILEGTVCPPAVFVERTTRWLVEFNRTILGPRDMTFPRNTPRETTIIRKILRVASSLIKSDQELGAFFMDKRALPEYMSALTKLSFACAVNPFNDYDLVIVLEHLELITRWETSSPSGVPGRVKRLISNGAIKTLGHCVRMGQKRHDGASLINGIFNMLDRYAAFPKVIQALDPAIREDLLPELEREEQSAAATNSGSNTTGNRHPELEGLAYRGAPLEYLVKERRATLCDNLQHRANFSARISGGKVCGKCHSVIYCSQECQSEDWRAIHRLECPEMHGEFRKRKARNSVYSQGTRAYQASLLLSAFERYCSTAAEGKGLEGKSFSTFNGVVNIDPIRGGKPTVKALGEWLSTTTPHIPSHLLSRFNSIVKLFVSVDGRCQEKSSPDTLAHTARLVERAFRFGDQDVNLLLLLGRGQETKHGSSCETLNSDMRGTGSASETLATFPSAFEIEGSLVYMSPPLQPVAKC